MGDAIATAILVGIAFFLGFGVGSPSASELELLKKAKAAQQDCEADLPRSQKCRLAYVPEPANE